MKMNHKILWGSAKQVFREKFLTLKTLLEETGLLERSKFSRYVFAKEQNKSKAGRNRDVQQYSVKKIFFFFAIPHCLWGLPKWLSGQEPTCQSRRHRRPKFNPWVSKIPWRREWQLTPAFLPRESHGQRSLTGCGPRGCKEQNTTDHTCIALPLLVGSQFPNQESNPVAVEVQSSNHWTSKEFSNSSKELATKLIFQNG